MSDSIVSYFLISGQELMGKQIASDLVTVTLSKPRVVATQITPNGQLGVMLLPLSVNTMETNMTIYRSAIMGSPNKIEPKLEKKYIEDTSGLVLAQ